MELNREQIIKALECCINDECICCPYDDEGVYSQCVPTLLENALSLIKQLTEENERLREENEQYRKATEKSVKRMQDKIMVEYEEQIDKIKAELEGK